jgi:urea carboxylase-associated protein 2
MADLGGTVETTWRDTIGAGEYTARRLGRDTVLRIDDVEGDACVQLLVLNAHMPSERFNPGDTLKIPWQAYLGVGSLLLSDLGRILLTIVADTSGRHDALCSASNRRDNDRRYGDGSLGGGFPNGRDLLALAGAKYGLSRADIGPCVNLFKRARVNRDGALELEAEPRPGTSIELRAELDVLVLLANTPHRLDARAAYVATPAVVSTSRPARPDPDPFRGGSVERERLFENTESHVEEMAP